MCQRPHSAPEILGERTSQLRFKSTGIMCGWYYSVTEPRDFNFQTLHREKPYYIYKKVTFIPNSTVLGNRETTRKLMLERTTGMW